MEAISCEATRQCGDYTAHMWVAILAMLHGTGLRSGELARLDIDAYDHVECTLPVDGRKTSHERCLLRLRPCCDAWMHICRFATTSSDRLA